MGDTEARTWGTWGTTTTTCGGAGGSGERRRRLVVVGLGEAGDVVLPWTCCRAGGGGGDCVINAGSGRRRRRPGGRGRGGRVIDVGRRRRTPCRSCPRRPHPHHPRRRRPRPCRNVLVASSSPSSSCRRCRHPRWCWVVVGLGDSLAVVVSSTSHDAGAGVVTVVL